MARRQKQPREGEVWIRSSDAAQVRVISVRARSVSYENTTTDRRGSSAVIGFLRRFQPKAAAKQRRAPLPSNVVDIKRWNGRNGKRENGRNGKRDNRAAHATRARQATGKGSGGFMTSG